MREMPLRRFRMRASAGRLRWLAVLLPCAVCFVHPGCSSEITSVSLPYPSEAASSDERSVDTTGPRDAIVVEEFTDKRRITDSLLLKRGLRFQDSSQVSLSQPLGPWITDEIRRELTRRGMAVITARAGTRAPVLSGTVISASARANVNYYMADLSMRIRLDRGDETLLNCRDSTGITRPGELPPTGPGVAATMSLALDEAVSGIADTVAAVLGIAPEVVDTPDSREDDIDSVPIAYDRGFLDSICELNKILYVVEGARTAKSIYEHLQGKEAIFYQYQRQRLDQSLWIFGDLYLLMGIDEAGQVTHVTKLKSTVGDTVLQNQVIRRLREIPFNPAPEGSGPTAVVYRVRFELLDAGVNAAAVTLRVLGGVLTVLMLLSLPRGPY